MKIFVALLFTAIVCVSESATLKKRDTAEDLKAKLLADVSKLITRATQLQATLKDSGKLTEAVALEAAVIAVKEVEEQLLTLHPNSTAGELLLVAAEATLAEVEKRLEAEVTKLESGGRKKRDVSEELKLKLLVDVTKLIAKATQLQDTLKDNGKLAEAVALEAAILAIKEVEVQLLTLHPNSTVGQILLVAAEATLQQVEKKLEAEELKLENGGRRKRDVSEDLKLKLLLDATKLIAKATQLQDTLKDNGKLAEAVALEAAILAVKDVEQELLTLHPNSTVGQILLVAAEATLAQVEKKLEAKELELENGGRRKRDVSEELKLKLLTDATKLIAKAAQLQDTLKDNGKLAEAVALEAAILAVKEVEEQLLTLHPNSTVGQILLVAAEATLQQVEKKLEAEELKIENGGRRRRDTKLQAKLDALAASTF